MSLTQRDRTRLANVHPDLVRVVEKARESVVFMVVEGVRTPERQRELFAQGRTKPGKIVTWTLNSNHFIDLDTGYGHAVDLLPAPYDWSNKGGEFDKLADAMFAAAKSLGVTIRWGADWDRDGIRRERGETDSPHFELDPKVY